MLTRREDKIITRIAFDRDRPRNLELGLAVAHKILETAQVLELSMGLGLWTKASQIDFQYSCYSHLLLLKIQVI